MRPSVDKSIDPAMLTLVPGHDPIELVAYYPESTTSLFAPPERM